MVSIEFGFSEELQELKAQILSIESTSSKRELELAIQKLKGREYRSMIYFNDYCRYFGIMVSIEFGFLEELQEHKAQILSTEGTSSKRELELVNQKLKGRESHCTLYFNGCCRYCGVLKVLQS